MALAASGVFFDGARQIFGIDSTNSNLADGQGGDASKSLGGSTIAGTSGRLLVNQLLPVGVALVQSVSGAETNTFTTRVAIGGTMLAPSNYPVAPTAGTLPAGALNLVGRTIRIKAGGTLGTTGTPNLTIDYALTAAGTNVLATTGVLAMQAATSPAIWYSEVNATVQTAGASGVIISNGHFTFAGSSGVLVTPWSMGNTTRGTGLTVDLTAAQPINIFATCGTSSASNRIICNTFSVEILF